MLAYKATDPSGAFGNGSVTVASAGLLVGGTVDLFDSATKLGAGVLEANGTLRIAVTTKLTKGKHTITAVFAGTDGAATSQASLVVKVKKK